MKRGIDVQEGRKRDEGQVSCKQLVLVWPAGESTRGL
jgi:hypothetical protein